MNRQATVDHYADMEREAREALPRISSKPILPGVFHVVSHCPSYGVRRFTMSGPVENYTDNDLLHYCNWTPQFGGRVERFLDGALITVYTE